MSLVLLLKPPATQPDVVADPNPLTITIRDRGHTLTLRERSFALTIRERP